MCRLIGWATTQPATLGELVGPGQLQALRDVSLLHPDGWGAALLDDAASGPRVHRSTVRAGADDDFLTMASAWSAPAGLVHLRRATDGFAVREANTHPFVADGWAFAHNGGIPRSERIDALMGGAWRDRRRGDTDSERFFLALLERIDKHGDVLEGIRSGVADVRDRCGLASMNAVLLGPGTLAVVHASLGARPPTEELLESVGGVPERLPRGHGDRYYELVYRASRRGVVVSSTGMPDDSWDALPPESVLLCDLRRSEWSISSLDAGAPAVPAASLVGRS